jgi:hypothetical protein
MLPAPDLHPLIRKLESIAPVSTDERGAIAALPAGPEGKWSHQQAKERPRSSAKIGTACRRPESSPHVPPHKKTGGLGLPAAVVAIPLCWVVSQF